MRGRLQRHLCCVQTPAQQAPALPSAAAAAPGLPAASAAAPALQTVPEQGRLQPGQEPKEDVFAKNTPEELMLGGHGEGDVSPRPPRSSSLTEALASEAREAADSAAPGQPTMAPAVRCTWFLTSSGLCTVWAVAALRAAV